jgi:hypothetical protein
LYLIFKPDTGLTAKNPGNVSTEITYADMYDTDDNWSANRSYSIWFFISNWSTDNEKNILYEGAVDGDHAVKVYLGKDKNNLHINATQNGHDPAECTVENVPLQKWINVIVTIYNRSIDTYLNGKLINTCVLDNTVSSSKGKSVIISKQFGFDGFTAKFQYFGHIVNPQEAWNIYSDGFEEKNWLKSMFSSEYGVKLSWMRGDNEKSSISI